MRILKKGCYVRASILDGSTTSVLNIRTDALRAVPQAIRSANVLTVRNGTLTTSGRNAQESAPACGAHRTISIKSVLFFKTKTKNMRNVQTAMKHIRHGQKTAWHSKQPLKAHHNPQWPGLSALPPCPRVTWMLRWGKSGNLLPQSSPW